jgi:MFS family permease
MVAAIAAIYTFYYSGFAVAGLFAAALASGRRRRELLIAGVCLGVAVLPLIPTVLLQVGAHPTQSEGDLHQTNVRTLLLTRTFGLLFWTGTLYHASGFALVAGWAGVLAWARLRDGAPRWSRQETLWLLTALVPWILLLVVEQSGSALVLPRHRVVVLPALLILLATILDRIRHPQWRRAATGLTLLTFGLLYISNLRNRDDFDWRAAARVLTEQRAAGEPVVVFTSDGVLPLRWHYREPGALLPLPAEPDLEHYDPTERYLRDSVQVRERIESVVRPGQSFWLVQRQYLPRVAGDSLLLQYLDHETSKLGEWRVPGIELIRLQRMAR